MVKFLFHIPNLHTEIISVVQLLLVNLIVTKCWLAGYM